MKYNSLYWFHSKAGPVHLQLIYVWLISLLKDLYNAFSICSSQLPLSLVL